MNEDKHLDALEKEWSTHFARFTTPVPTHEDSLALIAKVKEADVVPVDLRLEIESDIEKQSFWGRAANLLLSQWNFYGAKSWVLTGLLVIASSYFIGEVTTEQTPVFLTWIKYLSLLTILVIAYAFRQTDEGNAIIETLSYYTVLQQLFARFFIVVMFQLLLAFPLSILIIGQSISFDDLISWSVPLFFFATICFTLTVWFGNGIGTLICLLVWGSQLFIRKEISSFSLFQAPSDVSFYQLQLCLFVVSVLLLSVTGIKGRRLI